MREVKWYLMLSREVFCFIIFKIFLMIVIIIFELNTSFEEKKKED